MMGNFEEEKVDVRFGCVSLLEKKGWDSRKRTDTLAGFVPQSF